MGREGGDNDDGMTWTKDGRMERERKEEITRRKNRMKEEGEG